MTLAPPSPAMATETQQHRSEDLGYAVILCTQSEETWAAVAASYLESLSVDEIGEIAEALARVHFEPINGSFAHACVSAQLHAELRRRLEEGRTEPKPAA